MQQIIAIIGFINSLFPLILSTIKTVEAAFPQSGQGAAKFAIVQSVVQHAIDVSTELQVTASQVMPILAPLVSSTVSLLNAAGEFKKV